MSPTSCQLLHPAILSSFLFSEKRPKKEITRTRNRRRFTSSSLCPSGSNGAGDRGRTGTIGKDRGILSPVRLPIPPPRRIGSKGGTRTHSLSVNSRVLHHWATLEYLSCSDFLPPTTLIIIIAFLCFVNSFFNFFQAFSSTEDARFYLQCCRLQLLTSTL